MQTQKRSLESIELMSEMTWCGFCCGMLAWKCFLGEGGRMFAKEFPLQTMWEENMLPSIEEHDHKLRRGCLDEVTKELRRFSHFNREWFNRLH